jgi:ABC-type molybdate transport system substrate-binding protein
MIEALEALDPREVCIANPAFAPYGEAAWAVLNRSGIASQWLQRIVRVDNINLVTGLVAQRQVKAGFIARSSLVAGLRTGSVSVDPSEVLWLSDQPGIAQALVVMRRAAGNTAAQFWVEQMRAEAVRDLIRRDGYEVPLGKG